MHGRFIAIKALSEADLIIGLGIRFADRATGDKVRFKQKANIIHVDIDSCEHGKNIDSSLEIQGNLKEAVEYLYKNAEEKKNFLWKEEIEGQKEKRKDMSIIEGTLTPWQVIGAVNKKAPEEAIIATDVGQHQMWVAQYYNFKNPRTLLTSGGLGTMGYGMGAAIGGAMATGKRTILFTGDGSFGMNLNELATAVSENLPIVIILLNNGVLGMIRQWQSLFFDEKYIATILDRKTDFVKLAEAFGAKGYRATNIKDLNVALDQAFICNSPVVIECIVPCEENVFPMVPPNGSVDNIILK